MKKRFSATVELRIEFVVDVPDGSTGYPEARKRTELVREAAHRGALNAPGMIAVTPFVVNLRG